MKSRTSYLPTLLLVILLATTAFKFPAEKPVEDLKSVEWMLGIWQRTNVRPGTAAFEKWERQNDKVFTGKGWSMKGTDTTFVELLRMEVKEDALYYVADVKQNATPIYFKVTEQSKTSFRSENLKHDFPKVISYQLEGKKMTAIISDGGDKKMGFVFEKVEQ